jgi:hypothetical protein
LAGNDPHGSARRFLYWNLRRVTASVLFLAFSLSLIAPLTAPDRESALPSCCRRDGRHGCDRMRRAAAGASDGPAWKSGKSVCPLFPPAQALPMTPPGLPARPATLAVPVLSVRLCGYDPARALPASRAGARFTRGPPRCFV